jgi:hypothetical protein
MLIPCVQDNHLNVRHGSITDHTERLPDDPEQGGTHGSAQNYHPQGPILFQRRNLDARLPPILRDLAPLLLRLARVRLNVGSGPTGPAHPADQVGAVAQRSSLL